MQYVWCEDSASGFRFWQAIFETLHPEICVESKQGHTELRKAVKRISDDGNTYYILMDQAVNNPDVLRELTALNKAVSGKSNVRMIDIHSFEFSLLPFRLLEQWVFAEEDELKEKRQNFLRARELFIDIVQNGGGADKLAELKNLLALSKALNTEQLAAKLLEEITRNTGCETSKKKLGFCFVHSCCEWKERQADDTCGLDKTRLTSAEKRKKLVEFSVLKDAFAKVGLA